VETDHAGLRENALYLISPDIYVALPERTQSFEAGERFFAKVKAKPQRLTANAPKKWPLGAIHGAAFLDDYELVASFSCARAKAGRATTRSAYSAMAGERGIIGAFLNMANVVPIKNIHCRKLFT
jgi:hypothetical protein